ncbi:alpha/beta hydrolase [Streptomyces sp. NBC_00338]|uniref:alpha/beta hydrolase n=1 Tax=unclassified Streptomyces TaxID=2593676 RepID=UPI0022564803|nr:alpha/beta hydrolase [Streptomyces sp. NBC_00338]MCX5138768.1 alpha/beta hydrolase [Streptomyces sp. NBC_00338]WSU57446.1 alpha/beta hydrolase [Streptomyces sp. NBC_01104]
MDTPVMREKVRFDVGGTYCAAWHYPGTNGGCVIMAGGGGVTKEPGTDPFAARFHAAGFTVLAFDYRCLGESGGGPRQTVRIKDQLDDWQAAIAFAASLPDADPARTALWGFSLSGGHVLRVAARNPQLAAAVAQTPNADGPAASRSAAGHQRPLAALRLAARILLDMAGGLLGRRPLLVPLAGDPGTVAMLTTPDGIEGDKALNPGNTYPQWRQEIAARSIPGIIRYRPGLDTPQVRPPLLVLVCDQDRSVLSEPAVRAAGRAPRAEVVRLPGGHYAPFTDQHEQAVDAELSFLRRHLLVPAAEGAAEPQGRAADLAP